MNDSREFPRGKPVVLIVGPTATGKSQLGIRMAQACNGEIISADSMQVYRGMNIGTAKVTEDEMDGVVHHGLSIVDPREPFSVADYQSFARQTIADIHNRGKLPIVVGGTGLYMRAIVQPMNFAATVENAALRRQLTIMVTEQGVDALYEQLLRVDPVSASRLAKNDVRRVVRALEVYMGTGVPMSQLHQADDQKWIYPCACFGLTLPRDLLYCRINERVDQMMESGLLKEVSELLAVGCDERVRSMQAIGYKELLAHLRGEMTLEQSVETIKLASRRYAKRQLSWFRNVPEVMWIDARETSIDHPIIRKGLQELWKVAANKLG